AAVAVDFFRARDAAERALRHQPRLLWRLPPPDVLRGCHLEVAGDFVVQLAVEPRPAKQREHAPGEAPHVSSPESLTKRPTMPAARCHPACSACNCFRPFLVIE